VASRERLEIIPILKQGDKSCVCIYIYQSAVTHGYMHWGAR